MTLEQFAQREKELLAEEAKNPEHLMWLSFASETAFLGGAYIISHGPLHAIRKTRALGINPGGSVQAYGIPFEYVSRVKTEWMNRLLTKDEIVELDKVVFKK